MKKFLKLLSLFFFSIPLFSCSGFDSNKLTISCSSPTRTTEYGKVSLYFDMSAQGFDDKSIDMVEWHSEESSANFTYALNNNSEKIDGSYWSLTFTTSGSFNIYATVGETKSNTVKVNVKEGPSMTFTNSTYLSEVRTPTRLLWDWHNSSGSHYLKYFTFKLTENTANASVEWVAEDKTNHAYITAENAGSVNVQIFYNSTEYGDRYNACSDIATFSFDDNNDYTVTFIDRVGHILKEQVHKYDEKINVPQISDEDFIGWSNGKEVVKFGNEITLSKNEVFYPVFETTNESLGLKFESVDGGLMVTGYSGYDYDVVIPSSHNGELVVAIGDEAFKSKTITSVSIPYSVEKIGAKAFYNASIKKCTFDNGSVLQTLSNSVFDGCSNLEYILLGRGLSSIGKYCFDRCGKLVIMFSSETTDGISLTSYWNDDSRPYYVGVLSDCGLDSTGMYDYVLMKDGTAGIRKFVDSTVSTNLNIASVDGYIVSTIMYGSCSTTGLKTLKISSNVKTIGSYAFKDCPSLENVDFSEAVALTKIGDNAFRNCVKLVSINLKPAANLTTLGASAFDGDTSLEDILIPASVNSIGKYCFDGCSKLRILFESTTDHISFTSYWNDDNRPIYTNVSFVVQKDSTNRFKYFVKNNNKAGIIFYYQSDITDVNLIDKIDGYSVGYICYHAFDSTNITKIDLPATLELIDSYAFYKCTSLLECNIQDNSELTTLGASAIDGCSELIAFKVPFNVKSIGKYCFDGCSKLNILFEAMDTSEISLTSYWNDDNRPCYYAVKALHYERFNVNGSFYYFETYRKTLGFLKWIGYTNDCGPTNDISITSLDVEGKGEVMPFTEICSYAFSGRKSYDGSGPFDWIPALTHIKITIGASVEKIGSYAFYNLYTDSIYGTLYSSDTYFKVVFEKNSNIKSIGTYAFCSSHLEGDVILGKQLESVGAYAFGLSSWISDSYKIWIEKGDKSGVSLGNYWNGKRTVYWGTEWEYNGSGIPVLK